MEFKEDYGFLCPKCNEITYSKDWEKAGECHWTDTYDYKRCPICKKRIPENELYVKKYNDITVDIEDYKKKRLEFEIKKLEERLKLKKEHLERLR